MCLPKVMVVLCDCCVFLLFRPAIVFQRMCVFVLWSQSSSKCCFHMSVLCSCMSLSISALRTGSCGSLWSCCRVVFLLVIRSLMFCGSNLVVLCILPLGMWCLSVGR